MKRTIFRKFLRITFLTAVLALTCGTALAATQEVSLSPAAVSASPGQTVQLDLNYQILDGKRQTTGLGLRIHYNSKAVEGVRFENLYAEGLVAQDESGQEDLKDLDNDPSTDRYLGVAWVGIQGDWPAIRDITKLGRIAFTVLKGGGAETRLTISYSSKPAGYDFRGQGATITIK